MNTNRNATTCTADQIVVGMKIIPTGCVRPLEIVFQMSAPESASYFEFACRSGRALRLHRSDVVTVA